MEELLKAVKCLEYLEETSSRKEKLQLLHSAVDNSILKELFRRSYDWTTTYGMTVNLPDLPKMKTVFAESYPINKEWGIFLTILDELATRHLTGTEGQQIVERFLKAVDASRAKWYARVINRDLKVGVNVSTFGKVWPDLKSEFGVSLADTYDPLVPLSYPLAVEPKLDGLRITTIFKDGGGVGKTRGKKEYNEVLQFILETLAPLVKTGAVDGEILADWAPSGPKAAYGGKMYKSPWGKTQAMLKTGTSKGVFNPDRVTDTMWEEIQRDLKFWVFDRMSMDVYDPSKQMDSTPFVERRAALEELVSQCPEDGPIRLVPQFIVNDLEELDTKHVEFLAQKQEGSMIKMLNAAYTPLRTSAMLKRKENEFIDGYILEVLPGKVGGRNENRAGSYRVRWRNGEVGKCNVLGDRLRDLHWEMRYELPGTWIEATKQKDGIAVTDGARFGVFVRIRDDLPKVNLGFSDCDDAEMQAIFDEVVEEA